MSISQDLNCDKTLENTENDKYIYIYIEVDLLYYSLWLKKVLFIMSRYFQTRLVQWPRISSDKMSPDSMIQKYQFIYHKSKSNR